MKYYGIKTPKKGDEPINIWWIGEDEHSAWSAFFRENHHTYPIEEARRAYEAIGYKCVELTVTEKKGV